LNPTRKTISGSKWGLDFHAIAFSIASSPNDPQGFAPPFGAHRPLPLNAWAWDLLGGSPGFAPFLRNFDSFLFLPNVQIPLAFGTEIVIESIHSLGFVEQYGSDHHFGIPISLVPRSSHLAICHATACTRSGYRLCCVMF
jgi:hypothetical protein